MEITKITVLGFGVDERGEQFAKIEFKPLIGESKEAPIIDNTEPDSRTET